LKTFQEGRHFDRHSFLRVPMAAAARGLLGGRESGRFGGTMGGLFRLKGVFSAVNRYAAHNALTHPPGRGSCCD
jgi:hypothetical protein